MAKVFKARWGGTTCSECGDEIKQGEMCSYLGGNLVHEECGFSGLPSSGWPEQDDYEWY